MDRVILERLETGDQGTFGRIRIGDEIFFTGELPWRDNKSNHSCIPAGIYYCQWTLSNRFKKFMYQVDDVNGRTGIRIHSANFMGDATLGYKKQLNGCISLGKKLAKLDGQKAIIISSPAVRKFEELMRRKPFILEIINGNS